MSYLMGWLRKPPTGQKRKQGDGFTYTTDCQTAAVVLLSGHREGEESEEERWKGQENERKLKWLYHSRAGAGSA